MNLLTRLRRWWHVRSCGCCIDKCPYNHVGCPLCKLGGISSRAMLLEHRDIMVKHGVDESTLKIVDWMLEHPERPENT